MSKYFIILSLVLIMLGCDQRDYPFYIEADNNFEYAVIIDNTTSMDPYIDDYATTIGSFTEKMSENEKMMIIITHSSAPWVKMELTNDKAELIEVLSDIYPIYKSFEAYDLAVELAMESFSKDVNKAILLLGDGMMESLHPDEVIYHLISKSIGNNAALFTITTGDEKPDGPRNIEVLEKIAKAGNGRYLHLADPSNLGNYYEEIKNTAVKNYFGSDN